MKKWICFFKEEVIRQKKKEGWKVASISKRKEGISKRQGLVLTEKEE